VSNIFSRVTGGSASSIDGILKANGTANLFLLNPNGIIFGQNASLSIGGSFVGTTANAIGFGTLGTFSASTLNNPSVLTVNPNSFLFNQIAAQSVNSQANLQVSTGNSLLLLGGNVSLDGSNGGQILAPGGRVELGGLAGTGTVGLNVNETILSLTFPVGVPRANVSLNNGVIVNVRAGGGGSIAVNANNLNMFGGSKLRAGIAENSGLASSQGGDIDVDVTDAITFDNGSRTENTVQENGTGNAGNVFISTKSLSLSNVSVIAGSTLGQGNGGNVTISASDFIKIDGINFVGSSVSPPRAVGRGGNVSITSKSLSLTNGGTISASTVGQGNAGNVTISASDFIKIDGIGIVASAVFPGAVGSGGNVSIISKSLSLTNGGYIATATGGQGNAGNVTINASDFIKIDGVFSGTGTSSGVYNGAYNRSNGNGGDINITSPLLSITNGGVLSAITLTDYLRFAHLKAS